jgi:hypothetical protein
MHVNFKNWIDFVNNVKLLYKNDSETIHLCDATLEKIIT